MGRVRFGLLQLDDIDAALALSTGEGWNQTATDWSRLVRLAPAGCFAARDGNRLVGTVTSITYGTALAWVGMMVIHPEFRRRGLGAALMRLALGHLRDRAVASVGLDATPAGRPLYESLGFTADAELERWQGRAPASAAAGSSQAPNESLAGGGAGATQDDGIRRLDNDAYGVDRSRLLESLVAEGVGEPLVVTSKPDGCVGYALARRGRTAAYLGPLVAATPNAAIHLLDILLSRFAGEDVCFDLHGGGLLAPGVLAERGFTMHRRLTRMYLGRPHRGGRPQWICTTAGPELG